MLLRMRRLHSQRLLLLLLLQPLLYLGRLLLKLLQLPFPLVVKSWRSRLSHLPQHHLPLLLERRSLLRIELLLLSRNLRHDLTRFVCLFVPGRFEIGRAHV